MSTTVRSVSGSSVTGPRHVRAGRRNEDALGWSSFDGSANGLRTVAVVADGHGSELCSRSREGSELAVRAAVAAAEEVCASIGPGTRDRAAIVVEYARYLWLAAVDDDLAAKPLDDRQLQLIRRAGGLHADERIAYGCTLLVAAVTDDEVLLGQIGDGEITAVTPDGGGWFPLGRSPEKETATSDSLCLPGAEKRARTATFDVAAASLLMLMTDGCTNAYNNPDELLLVGADTVRLERGTGLRRANLALETWLTSAADRSEDDATLVAVWI